MNVVSVTEQYLPLVQKQLIKFTGTLYRDMFWAYVHFMCDYIYAALLRCVDSNVTLITLFLILSYI